MFHLAAGFMPTMIAPHMEGFITLSLFKVDGYLGDAGTLVDSYISEKIMQHKEQIATFRKRDKRLFLADKILVFQRACSELSGYKSFVLHVGFCRCRDGKPRQFIFPSVLICQQGFRYHYAEPSYLMLAKWIAETFDTLPANASHRVGIGAFVMNDMGEVLVVQENSGTFTGTGVWKAPTGVVDEVALLASCVRWGLKVLSAMGAGT
ncbi:hypothetical protein RHMOL_Rhmol07G0247500 [Rhododendron molle]|uniref:Uncharacterized protein n=1 Tax=Rhododendron molle TaxID=49168 RepID=A0ACC0N4D1_RHOML|nr:hypothetical protein RHMOL_Rhmol07G0247500 [Rhododendron molle]